LLLDAFAERLQAERLAELNERVDQRCGLFGRRDALDERRVDLDRVNVELAEVGERAVAGAEVVDRNAYAEVVEPLSRRAVASGFSISVVSVTSSVSAPGSRPLTASAVRTSSISSSRSSWRAETLTAIPIECPRLCQSAACRQASSSTQRPIGTIVPVRSAVGMNWSGATTPRTGWRHRINASTPFTLSLWRSKVG
jgi:hypothetical protein